ncbi:MAG: hypothetical protein RIR86_2512 [Acidobacteriota bacterium]|jgi:hypothetical protein
MESEQFLKISDFHLRSEWVEYFPDRDEGSACSDAVVVPPPILTMILRE